MIVTISQYWLGIRVEDELPPHLQSSYAAGHIPILFNRRLTVV
jgi:hypothetical protein